MNTKIKLTKGVVEALPFAEKGKQIDFYDKEFDGFGVRVSHTGKKYFVRGWVDGKRIRVMIGSHPIKTAEEARSEAKIKLGQMESGIDPNEREREKVKQRKAKESEITVKKLISEYIDRHAKVKKRSWEADERLLKKEIIQVWGTRKAKEITKRDVTLLLESIIDRGTPAMSNQVLKIARKVFNFGIERDIIQHTPFTGVKALAPNNIRERALSEVEIKTLWEKLTPPAKVAKTAKVGSISMSDEIKRALKLVLVTAQRPGEVAGMRTGEIDGIWWTIPADRAKNGKTHRVYLTDLALELIGDTTGKDFIFPCPHQDKIKPIEAHALPVAVRRNFVWPLTDSKGKALYTKDGKPATENRLGVDHFTPHDLRRTAATFMAKAGEMDEVIDAVLNHAKKGVIKVYNQYRYDREKRIALEAWERKLKSIITGKPSGKVVPIKKAISE